MNFNLLIKTLIDVLFPDKKKSYDPINDFQIMLNSPKLAVCVLDQFEEEVRNELYDLHKEPDLFRIVLTESHFKLFGNDELKIDKDYENRGNNIRNIVLREVAEYAELKNVIFSVEINENVGDEIRKWFDDALDHVITFVENTIFVLEISKDDMFSLRLKKESRTSNQYFYVREGKFYCAFFKTQSHSKFGRSTYASVICYLLKRVPDVEVDETAFKTYREYTGSYEHSFSFDDYLKYILAEVMKKVSHPKDFFKVNFLRSESNNFFKCLDILRKNGDIELIMEQYIETLSEKQFLKLATAFCRICLCKSRRYQEGCHFFSKNHDEDIEMIPCQTLLSLSKYEQRLDLEDFVAAELRKFFTYAFKNHSGEIMNLKDKFLKIMSSCILKNLRKKFMEFEKLVSEIILYYNVKNSDLKNKHWKDLFKILEDKLNPEFKKTIINYCFYFFCDFKCSI